MSAVRTLLLASRFARTYCAPRIPSFGLPSGRMAILFYPIVKRGVVAESSPTLTHICRHTHTHTEPRRTHRDLGWIRMQNGRRVVYSHTHPHSYTLHSHTVTHIHTRTHSPHSTYSHTTPPTIYPDGCFPEKKATPFLSRDRRADRCSATETDEEI